MIAELEVSAAAIGMELDLGSGALVRSELLPPTVDRLPDLYTGPYEVIPAAGEQVLATSRRSMTRDVVVGAIPSNYGLITWNGSVLTVS